jgi:hypothetical protein
LEAENENNKNNNNQIEEDYETKEIISVAEAVKEITNEMTAIVKETVDSIREEDDEILLNENIKLE